jgi:photosystem II stability/assembly factor-like uncharacterized protein
MPAKGRRIHHDERTLLFVGTRKGVFVYESDFEREKWKRTGPYLADQAVPSLAYDHRDLKSLYAATAGAGLHRTRDFGRTWEKVGRGLPTEKLSHVTLGHLTEAGSIFAGCDGGAIAKSKDGGESFSEIEGFRSVAAGASGWGRPGPALVTSIVVHPASPKKLHVAVSNAGVFRTDDGGETWIGCNEGLGSGQPTEISRLVSNPAKPERLYAATHAGLFRTEDGGATWVDASGGMLPAPGRPVTRSIVVSPSKPGTVFAVPLVTRNEKEDPKVDGALAIRRSTDAGEHWDLLAEGLPERVNATMHREAMRIDTLDEEGIYFALSDGSIFVSLDEGENWTQIVSGLAQVLSLEAIAEPE